MESVIQEIHTATPIIQMEHASIAPKETSSILYVSYRPAVILLMPMETASIALWDSRSWALIVIASLVSFQNAQHSVDQFARHVSQEHTSAMEPV